MQTSKNLGVKSHTVQPQPNTTCMLAYDVVRSPPPPPALPRCPNHHLSVLLQLSPDWAPKRPFSNLYNSYRSLQPVSFSLTLNSLISSPSHWLSSSSYWIQNLNPLLPVFPVVRWPPHTWQDYTVAPYLQAWTENSILQKHFMSTFPPISLVCLHLISLFSL